MASIYSRKPLSLEEAIDSDLFIELDYALKRGADAGQETKDGRPMLAHAIAHFRTGGEQTVQRLLDAGADPSASHEGRTMLMMAAMRGRPTIVAMLIAAGAEKNCIDEDGWTAMMWSSSASNCDLGAECAVALAKAGAAMDVASFTGSTALMLFAAKAQPLAVKALLEMGADPCLRSSNGKRAAACTRSGPRFLSNHQACEEILLEAEARSDMAVDLEVLTPMATASRPRRI